MIDIFYCSFKSKGPSQPFVSSIKNPDLSGMPLFTLKIQNLEKFILSWQLLSNNRVRRSYFLKAKINEKCFFLALKRKKYISEFV
jgi:hypothetical protein